jgi:hypothetical protein
LAQALIERSSFEGPDVYREIRKIAQRRWSRAGQVFEEGSDPEVAVKQDVDRTRFFALEVAGASRAQQVLAAWWARFRECLTLDDAAAQALSETLLRQRLDTLDAAEGRARTFKPEPPERQVRNWWVLVGYVALLLVVALLVRRVLRRRRRA